MNIFSKYTLTFIDMFATMYVSTKVDMRGVNMKSNVNVKNYELNAKIFKAFCDENRLMILEMLKDGEKCACVLLEKLDIVQSTLSHHMKILVDSGIVTFRKNGKWTNYALSSSGSNYAKQLLDEITKINNGNGGN